MMKRSLLFISTLFSCTMFAQVPQMVINEVDYDQPSTDEAEFIELKNTGTDPIPLGDISVDLVNGANGGSAVYLTLEDPNWPILMPGEFFVICGNANFTMNCDADVQPDDNLIQNGAPDAISLRLGMVILDVMSYEGSVPGFVETSGDSLLDPSWGGVGNYNQYKSISRIPDGSDTGDNNVDFEVACITPGTANMQDTTNCGLTTSVTGPSVSTEAELFAYVIPESELLMFNFEQDQFEHMELRAFDLNGRELFSKSNGATNKWSGGIPVGHLRNNMIILQFVSRSNVVARRIWIP